MSQKESLLLYNDIISWGLELKQSDGRMRLGRERLNIENISSAIRVKENEFIVVTPCGWFQAATIVSCFARRIQIGDDIKALNNMCGQERRGGKKSFPFLANDQKKRNKLTKGFISKDKIDTLSLLILFVVLLLFFFFKLVFVCVSHSFHNRHDNKFYLDSRHWVVVPGL